MFHSGSSAMAHELDRFSRQDFGFEDLYGEAARLEVQPETLAMYLDWYGAESVTVRTGAGLRAMPRWEAELRWQVRGEKLAICRQLPLPSQVACRPF